MKKVTGILVFCIVVAAVTAGIVFYVVTTRFKYNDEDAVGNTAGNLYNGGLFCEYEEYIYFANPNDGNQLYRMDENGENLKKIHSDRASYINIYNDYVYYVRFNHSDSREEVFRGNLFGVYRQKLGSSEVTELYNGIAQSVVLVGNKLYFKSYDDKNLIQTKSVGVDGKNLTAVDDKDYIPLSVYNRSIYFANVDENHNIVKLNTANDSIETVKTGNFYMPVMEDNKLYYIDVEAGYKLTKENLSTGEKQILSEDKCINYNVSTKYGVIYYQCENDENDHKLVRMKLDGNGKEVVAEGDYSNIHITEKYTYYYRIAGAEKKLYKVETNGEISPEEFR